MTFNFAQKNRNMRILKFIVTFILLMGSVSNSLAQVNPEKPDVPLNKNDAFQKVQKRRVQEKR